MPTASIGVAVRKAVADGLAAHFASLSSFNGTAVAEQKTAVSFGYDFSNLPREQVYTGRSRWETPPAALRSGRNTRDEEGHFDLNLLVRVVASSDTDGVYGAELRADAIGAEIENWFADRKGNQLGVTGLLSLVLLEGQGDYMKVENGWAVVRRYDIRYTSRLE